MSACIPTPTVVSLPLTQAQLMALADCVEEGSTMTGENGRSSMLALETMQQLFRAWRAAEAAPAEPLQPVYLPRSGAAAARRGSCNLRAAR